MSYNIDSVKVIRGQLSITAEKLAEARQAVEHRPESNFLDSDLRKEGGFYKWGETHPGPLGHVAWNGECSGRTFDEFKLALVYTTGRAVLVLVWEGGDTITGLWVADGKVIEMDVRFLLTPKKEK